MGAVAVVLGEVHRPQQQATFQRPEGPIHRQELLVTEGKALDGQVLVVG